MQLGELIQQHVPRRDHATVAGSQAISRARLAASYAGLTDAARTLESAAAAALRLPHSDPLALTVCVMAGWLQRQAAALEAEHEAACAELATTFGFGS